MGEYIYAPLNEGAGSTVKLYTSRGLKLATLVGGDGTEWTANPGYYTGAAGKIIEISRPNMDGLYDNIFPGNNGDATEGVSMTCFEARVTSPAAGECAVQLGYIGANNFGLDFRAQNAPVDRWFLRAFDNGGDSTSGILTGSTPATPLYVCVTVDRRSPDNNQTSVSFTPGTSTEVGGPSTASASSVGLVDGNAGVEDQRQGFRLGALRNAGGAIQNPLVTNYMRRVTHFAWRSAEAPSKAELVTLSQNLSLNNGILTDDLLRQAGMSSIATAFNEQYDDPNEVKPGPVK